ncbi:N-acetylmuramoyl-L-alanine amidase AmiD [Gammaproteobacteria bacterium]
MGYFLLPLFFLIQGCGQYPLQPGANLGPYQLVSWPSASQDSRIQFLILHYTDSGDAHSLRMLTDGSRKVSAHYLVPRENTEQPFPVYQLVLDDQRAWHAGKSRWQNQAGLNASSLGMEIVNHGYPQDQSSLPIDQRDWQDFSEAQIAAVGALAHDLVERYRIPPTQVLAHSDVAPERKLDPGPRFPWRRLHDEYGVGAWPDETRVAELIRLPPPSEAIFWQQALGGYGYGVSQSGIWDDSTHQVLGAFQLHFRSSKVTSEPDAESWARLQALLEKYNPAH